MREEFSMSNKDIALMQYFRMTMSNHMFIGSLNIPDKIRAVTKEEYAKLKTIILSTTNIEEYGKGKYRLSIRNGNGSFLAQCKDGYIYVESITWKESAWN
jgi:hypothetical protein